MRKDLVGLYYLARIDSVLNLSQFWWLVLVFSMVYRWWTPAEVSSETHIHVLTILFRLPVSPPSSWRLMTVWTILKSTLSVELGSRIVPSLRNKSSAFLTSCMRRVMSPPSSTIRPGLWPCHHPLAISRHSGCIPSTPRDCHPSKKSQQQIHHE